MLSVRPPESPFSIRKPLTPGFTKSAKFPDLVAIIGFDSDMASTAEKPNASSHMLGIKMQSIALMALATSETRPWKIMPLPESPFSGPSPKA